MDVAALAISIFALAIAIVALPTVFQMFWGGPQVRFDFTEIDGSDGRRLNCQISSAPIESRILRRLGVRREPAIISAQFRICEAGSNRIMLDTAQASLINVAEWRGQGSFRATVTDHLPVSFLCAFHGDGDDGGRAIAADPLTRASTALPPGRYRVDIDVTCGERLFSHRQEMTVGERPIFTYWYRI